MTSTTITVEEAIDAAIHQNRRSVLLCPAHDDQSPSLSIGPGKEQPVVVHCHTGCSPEEVLAAVGMDWQVVCRERAPEDTTEVWTPAGTTTASKVYRYTDAEGTLLYEVLRVDIEGGKRFLQRRPDPVTHDRHIWNLDGVPRVLFNLPQVIEAVGNGRRIHIAEGEKCVRALETVIPAGEVATCNSGGAGKWREEFNEYLAGATCVIYADADDKGRQHARDVREQLVAVGARVRTVEAPAGTLRNGKPITDIADHIENGGTGTDLLETTPESDAERARTGVDVLTLVGMKRQPVEFVIDGTLARRERLVLVGLEGSGKSELCRQIAVCTAAGLHPFRGTRMEGRRVLFIDAENHPNQTVDSWANLVGLCAAHASPVEEGMLTVLQEWDAEHDMTRDAGRAWLRERVYGYRPDLVILGPLTNLVFKDLSDYETVHRLRQTINSIRDVCGSAIIMEHHAPLRGGGDKVREVRPYGSGLFLKWPDFGYSMTPTDETGTYEWRRTRGDRVRGRHWPDCIREGNPSTMEFPWMEAEPV